MKNNAETDMRIKEIYVNLKNFNFDIFSCYKMNEKEAEKFIEWFEEMNNINQ